MEGIVRLGEHTDLITSVDESAYDFSQEVRFKKILNFYPPLKGKSFVIIYDTLFSGRYRYWINKHSSELKIWFLNDLHVKMLEDNRYHFSSYNSLLEIDKDVYHLMYRESFLNYQEYNSNYIVFCNNSSDWSYESIINWIESFSKKVALFSHESYKHVANPKAFDRIFLKKGLLDDIKNEVDNFILKRDVYEDLEISWKRGFIFIGSPGNGKTSVIRGICDYWGLDYKDVHGAFKYKGSIDNSIKKLKKSEYIDYRLYPPTYIKPKVVILEDIDKYVVGQSAGETKHQDAGSDTLHNVLKSLDGINQINGVLLCATTNCPQSINEALINRPGRFDRLWRIDKPDKDQITQCFQSYGFNDDENIAFYTEKLSSYSMAFVVEFINSVRKEIGKGSVIPESSLKIIDRIKEHNDLYKKNFREATPSPFGFRP